MENFLEREDYVCENGKKWFNGLDDEIKMKTRDNDKKVKNIWNRRIKEL